VLEASQVRVESKWVLAVVAYALEDAVSVEKAVIED